MSKHSLAVAFLWLSSTPAAAQYLPACNGYELPDRTRAFLGKLASPEVLDQAFKKSEALTFRVIRSRQPLNKDWQEGRLNILVDKRNRIREFICG